MKYTVNGSVTVSVSVTVEAASEAEARAMAEEWQLPELCYQCTGGSEEFHDPSDVEDLPYGLGLDGTPQWDEVTKA